MSVRCLGHCCSPLRSILIQFGGNLLSWLSLARSIHLAAAVCREAGRPGCPLVCSQQVANSASIAGAAKSVINSQLRRSIHASYLFLARRIPFPLCRCEPIVDGDSFLLPLCSSPVCELGSLFLSIRTIVSSHSAATATSRPIVSSIPRCCVTHLNDSSTLCSLFVLSAAVALRLQPND